MAIEPNGETTNGVTHTAPLAEPSQEQPSKGKRHKPLDAAGRERAAKSAKVRRRFKALKERMTLEDQERAIAAMERELDGPDTSETTNPGEEPAAQPPASPVPVASADALEASPAPPSPRRGPSWPTDAEIDAARPEVATIVGVLSTLAHGTKLERCFTGAHPKLDLKKGEVTMVPKEQALTDALAPLWAKYVGAVAPMEVVCGLEILAIIAAPFIQDKIAAQQKKAAATQQQRKPEASAA